MEKTVNGCSEARVRALSSKSCLTALANGMSISDRISAPSVKLVVGTKKRKRYVVYFCVMYFTHTHTHTHMLASAGYLLTASCHVLGLNAALLETACAAKSDQKPLTATSTLSPGTAE